MEPPPPKTDTSDSTTPLTGEEGDDGTFASEKWRGGGDEHDEEASRDDHVDLTSSYEGELVFEKEKKRQDQVLRETPFSEISYKGRNQKDQGDSSIDSQPRRSYHQQPNDAENETEDKDHHLEPSEEDDDESAGDSKESNGSLLWKARMQCGKLVNNAYVQVTIIALIILNAMMMGLATFDFVTESDNVSNAFQKLDESFLVIFTVEIAMQLFYLGLSLFSDGWLVFDLGIVIFSWSFESMQVVRAFRIFRAFRLVTRVKPLRDLVLAIGAVLPRMYAIAALLLLVFYIFAVLFTEFFSDLPLSGNYFRTLDASLFTCIQMMTMEWSDIAREVMTYHSWAWLPFIAFVGLTGFIVFNLIVAVVCDAVAVTEKTVRELDGLEDDSPASKLEEAQERIDLLQGHLEDMLRTQQAVQQMIEVMSSELLFLESERMKAELREAELRIEVDRRMNYQRSMESTRQKQALDRISLHEHRRESGKPRRSAEDRREPPQRRESNGSGGNNLTSVSYHDTSRHGRRQGILSPSASRRSLMTRTSSLRSSSRNKAPVGSDRSLFSDMTS